MSLGGYDASFLSPVSKDLECPVCLLVLRDPLQTSCGHLFCKKCVDNMTRNSQFRCPLDKRLCKRSEVFPDRNVERKVLCLEVRCERHKQGCEWTGQLGHLQKHMAPDGDCEVAEVKCEFFHVGCTFKGPKLGIQEHADSNVKQHMSLLVKRVAQQDTLLGEQKRQLATQEQKLTKHEQKLSEQLQTITRLERLTGGSNKKDSKPDANQTSERVEIITVEHPFEWKIDGWASKLEEARQGRVGSITSRSFYNSRPGYKFGITLYPNGRKEGRGTHLALYVALLKGDYDGELQWPFMGRCTVLIVDQEGRGRCPSRTFNARSLLPDAVRNFERPTSAQNEGRGWQKFVSHGELMSWPHLTKHDNLLIHFECVV